MSELPDRLSTDPRSPFYNAEVLSRDVGIRFKGVEKNNVEEYCVSEGWVRVTAGSPEPLRQPLTFKLTGPARAVFPRRTVSSILPLPPGAAAIDGERLPLRHAAVPSHTPPQIRRAAPAFAG